jgi:hypothetical protein
MNSEKTKEKPLVVPKSRPRNPLGLHRKKTIRHVDKRNKRSIPTETNEKETYYD